MNLQPLLEKSSSDHSHLCPRQILGVRLGLAGLTALGFNAPPDKKQLLIITETDGCFADGLSTVTNCTVGHCTLRVEDYGKTVAVFVDVKTRHALRVAPMLHIRQRAYLYAPESRVTTLRKCRHIKSCLMKKCSLSPKYNLPHPLMTFSRAQVFAWTVMSAVKRS